MITLPHRISIDHMGQNATALKCVTWLIVLFYGEPDLMGAIIGLINDIGRWL